MALSRGFDLYLHLIQALLFRSFHRCFYKIENSSISTFSTILILSLLINNILQSSVENEEDDEDEEDNDDNDEEEDDDDEDEKDYIEEEEEEEEEVEEEELNNSEVLGSSNNVERRFASIVQGMKLSNLETGQFISVFLLFFIFFSL